MTEQKERELYFWLRLIREFEDLISALDKQGKIQGGVYSGEGQEAADVVGGCERVQVQEQKGGPRGGRLLRRGGELPGGRSRGDEFRRDLQAARRLRLREQFLRLFHPQRAAVRSGGRGRPGPGIRIQGGRLLGERPPLGDEGREKSDRPGAKRRGAGG